MCGQGGDEPDGGDQRKPGGTAALTGQAIPFAILTGRPLRPEKTPRTTPTTSGFVE
jgi:hypothetical protein